MAFYVFRDSIMLRSEKTKENGQLVTDDEAKELIAESLVKHGWTAKDGEADPQQFSRTYGNIRSGRPGFVLANGSTLEFID